MRQQVTVYKCDLCGDRYEAENLHGFTREHGAKNVDGRPINRTLVITRDPHVAMQHLCEHCVEGVHNVWMQEYRDAYDE